MPTRTERLVALTFLEKLSKINILQSKNSSQTLTKWLRQLKGPATGCKIKNTVIQKTEFLAASMFLHRHGLVEGRLEVLSKNEIDTLARLLCLERSKGKAVLVRQIRQICEKYTNGMSDSSDSSNTGEGSTSASQTSPQDLFAFAKRRRNTALDTSSEDDPDAELRDDSSGEAWRSRQTKKKGLVVKARSSARAEQDSFSSSSHEEETGPDADLGPTSHQERD
jgi:hypothetical protein